MALTLIELRDKIDKIIEKSPSYAELDRIGRVVNIDPSGFREMEWLRDIRTICCDGHGLSAIQLVMEDDDYFFGKQ